MGFHLGRPSAFNPNLALKPGIRLSMVFKRFEYELDPKNRRHRVLWVIISFLFQSFTYLKEHPEPVLRIGSKHRVREDRGNIAAFTISILTTAKFGRSYPALTSDGFHGCILSIESNNLLS